MTKIQFWKQFTTLEVVVAKQSPLYSVWQRYNFESNLQHIYFILESRICCIQYDKDTILKAIYNRGAVAQYVAKAVFSMTKIQFWKQFTTTSYVFSSSCCCIQYDKDTILKAIYNFERPSFSPFRAVFSMTKIQFWKQFTTINSTFSSLYGLYSVWQRYNFESNLQLIEAVLKANKCCIQYDKDTILKAIYNS